MPNNLVVHRRDQRDRRKRRRRCTERVYQPRHPDRVIEGTGVSRAYARMVLRGFGPDRIVEAHVRSVESAAVVGEGFNFRSSP